MVTSGWGLLMGIFYDEDVFRYVGGGTRICCGMYTHAASACPNRDEFLQKMRQRNDGGLSKSRLLS